MRVLVTGSRNWTDRALISRVLAEYLRSTYEIFTVIHGACPTGADAIADEWATDPRALALDVEVERHPVTSEEWHTLGRKAGPLRNRKMIDVGADVCLAFIRNGSPGASGTVRLAKQAGIPTKVWRE